MTIHVTVSEAEKRLAELISAAARGEEVILDQGEGPEARIVGMSARSPDEIARIAAKRRAAIGMFKHLVGDRDIDIAALRRDDRWEENDRTKFADFA